MAVSMTTSERSLILDIRSLAEELFLAFSAYDGRDHEGGYIAIILNGHKHCFQVGDLTNHFDMRDRWRRNAREKVARLSRYPDRASSFESDDAANGKKVGGIRVTPQFMMAASTFGPHLNEAYCAVVTSRLRDPQFRLRPVQWIKIARESNNQWMADFGKIAA